MQNMQTNSALEKKKTRPSCVRQLSHQTAGLDLRARQTPKRQTKSPEIKKKHEKRKTKNNKYEKFTKWTQKKTQKFTKWGQANTKHNDPLLWNPRSPPMPKLKPLKSMNFAAHFVDDFCGLPFPPQKKGYVKLSDFSDLVYHVFGVFFSNRLWMFITSVKHLMSSNKQTRLRICGQICTNHLVEF